MKKLCLCALLTDEITQNDLDRWRLPPMASKVIGKETISDGSSFAFGLQRERKQKQKKDEEVRR